MAEIKRCAQCNGKFESDETDVCPVCRTTKVESKKEVTKATKK